MDEKSEKSELAEGAKVPSDPHGKKTSIPGALAVGVFNGAAIALIAAVPGFNLPFILPGFAAIMLPMMAGPIASLTGTFMRLGYVSPTVRHLSGIAEHLAGAWSSWAVWYYYPLAFANLGLPPAVDSAAKIFFGIAAIMHGFGVLRHLVGLIKGDRDPKRGKRRARTMMRLKKDQDRFFDLD